MTVEEVPDLEIEQQPNEEEVDTSEKITLGAEDGKEDSDIVSDDDSNNN